MIGIFSRFRKNARLHYAARDDGFSTPTIKREFGLLTSLFAMLGQGAYVAGGFARYCVTAVPEDPFAGDIDIFFENIHSYRKVLSSFSPYTKKDSNNPAAQIRIWEGHELHLVEPRCGETVLTGGPWQQLLPHFDFTVCAVAILSPNFAFCVPEFPGDETRKILHPQRIENPFRTLARVQKYVKKGYYFPVDYARRMFDEYANRRFECQLSSMMEDHPEIVETMDVDWKDWSAAKVIE